MYTFTSKEKVKGELYPVNISTIHPGSATLVHSNHSMGKLFNKE